MELKIVGKDGQRLPEDGVATGDLWVRGACVVRTYHRHDNSVQDADGWFPTGDIGTIDHEGYLRLTDRSKDLIKSGGEWISSIQLELIACEHPAVHDAAVIGAFHEKWDERPVVIVERSPEQVLSEPELLATYKGRVAEWQIPDKVIFVEELPLGATGKPLKRELRDAYWSCLNPETERQDD